MKTPDIFIYDSITVLCAPWSAGRLRSTFPANGRTGGRPRCLARFVRQTICSGIEANSQAPAMTEKPVDLDTHRGMAAQKATELRRLLSEVAANEEALRIRQQELEDQLLAAPSLSWEEAAEKARYLLSLFASSLAGQDPRRQMLIARVLEDFVRLTALKKS
jgi:hypothetical protein